MIDHKNKCIFIHLPCTGGSVVEKSFLGVHDRGQPLGCQKHVFASAARKMYSEYWDDYYKFSLVRNPFARFYSMAKWDFYGVTKESNGKLNLDGYFKKFPDGHEHDPRTGVIDPNYKSKKGSLYSNFIDEKMDYICKSETLVDDLKHVGNKIGLKVPRHIKNLLWTNYVDAYTNRTKQQVQSVHSEDIKRFNYTFKLQ